MIIITVIKQDYLGNETWRYSGNLIARRQDEIVIEAHFNRDETRVAELVLNRGDRFVETYFSNHWYNIFEIYDHKNDHLKGWYCNVGYPAVITRHSITYRDLALDLLVYPNGKQEVLDEDEFSELPLPRQVQTAARQALFELQQRFSTT
jgi:predicted RNA-binding protein associated with RNAse of E/G family